MRSDTFWIFWPLPCYTFDYKYSVYSGKGLLNNTTCLHQTNIMQLRYPKMMPPSFEPDFNLVPWFFSWTPRKKISYPESGIKPPRFRLSLNYLNTNQTEHTCNSNMNLHILWYHTRLYFYSCCCKWTEFFTLLS